jgi:hypothetical protein
MKNGKTHNSFLPWTLPWAGKKQVGEAKVCCALEKQRHRIQVREAVGNARWSCALALFLPGTKKKRVAEKSCEARPPTSIARLRGRWGALRCREQCWSRHRPYSTVHALRHLDIGGAEHGVEQAPLVTPQPRRYSADRWRPRLGKEVASPRSSCLRLATLSAVEGELERCRHDVRSSTISNNNFYLLFL